MNPQEVRQRLIANTIPVIAKEGLDKTTTKSITYGTEINEAYIYHFFDHKEDFLAKAFEALDEELVKKMMQHVSVMNMSELECELRWRVLFEAVDNNDDTTEHLFRLLYCSILPYLKKEEQRDMEEAIVCRCR